MVGEMTIFTSVWTTVSPKEFGGQLRRISNVAPSSTRIGILASHTTQEAPMRIVHFLSETWEENGMMFHVKITTKVCVKYERDAVAKASCSISLSHLAPCPLTVGALVHA